MHVEKQQLELDMEQQTGSKSGEYIKAVYCHPAYLTNMQSTSYEMPGWMKHKLKSRLPEVSITPDVQMTPPSCRKWRTRESLDKSEKGEWESRLTAAAKLHQSCTTLCDPVDSSPPGSPVPGILQARTLDWVAISFSNAWNWKVKGSRSVVSDS